MITIAILFVALSFIGLFGINQSKNASSSATTTTTADSGNDNSAQSHNTDNSVGAGSSGTVAVSNKSNAVSGAGSTVNITDGSEGAFSIAKDAVARANDSAAQALASVQGVAGDAFAAQSRAVDDIAAAAAGSKLPDQSKQPIWLYIVGGLVALVGLVLALKKGK